LNVEVNKHGRTNDVVHTATLLIRASVSHTALMYAALSGRTLDVRTLLDQGADVNAIDHEGRTALMFAAVNMHSETVNTLMEHGAHVNARANDGGTALMLAACGGATEIVKSLVARGADASATFTMTNRTALVIAADRGYTEIVELLDPLGGQDCRLPPHPEIQDTMVRKSR
jgi:ankyrin repeat protein